MTAVSHVMADARLIEWPTDCLSDEFNVGSPKWQCVSVHAYSGETRLGTIKVDVRSGRTGYGETVSRDFEKVFGVPVEARLIDEAIANAVGPAVTERSK